MTFYFFIYVRTYEPFRVFNESPFLFSMYRSVHVSTYVCMYVCFLLMMRVSHGSKDLGVHDVRLRPVTTTSVCDE